MKFLVTGSSGFIGQALVRQLRAEGHEVVAAARNAEKHPGCKESPALSASADWSALVNGCDVVIHAAARAHLLRDTEADPLQAFREVNTAGTLALARQAAQANVRRFVFISSIGVNGAISKAGRPFSEQDPVAPHNAYAVSKAEAEAGLRQLTTGMEIVILRPPLVYGPDVPANFLRLLRTVDRGMPLPFGAVRNQRSLIYLGNLVSAISLCAVHPAAAGRCYLVSDGQDLSTPELIAAIARGLGRRMALLPVPTGLMTLVGRMLGRGEDVKRLFGSLAVDSGAIRRELGWVPPYSVAQGLEATTTWYRTRKQ